MSRLLLLLPILAASPFTTIKAVDLPKTQGLFIVDIPKPEDCSGVDPWADASVAGWPAAHGASAVRYEPKRQGESVQAVVAGGYYNPPMMVALKDGQPLDRVCGCLTAVETVAWLDGVAEGRTRADTLRAGLSTEGVPDTAGWILLAQAERCANRPMAALNTIFWLWDSLVMSAPEQRSERLRRLPVEMGQLARNHPEAAAAIAARRDDLVPYLQTNTDAMDDWVSFTRTLLQDDLVVALYDEHKADPRWAKAIQHIAPTIFVLLVGRDRWADAGLVMTSPTEWLDYVQPETVGLGLAVDGYAVLLAAGRDKEAATYAKDLMKRAPQATGCLLVSRALDAGQARKEHKAMLKDCPDELKARWSAALL